MSTDGSQPPLLFPSDAQLAITPTEYPRTTESSQNFSMSLGSTVIITQDSSSTEPWTSTDQLDDDVEVWGLLQSYRPDVKSIRLVKQGTLDSKGAYLIGRHRECDVVMDVSPLISNRHCLIYRVCETTGTGLDKRTAEHVYLHDLSANGTFLNGDKLGKDVRRELKHGDQVQLYMTRDADEGVMFVFRQPRRIRRGQAPVRTIDDQIRLTRLLGQGYYANVKLGMDRITGELFAVKEINKHKFITKPKVTADIQREISILMALDHPCITSVYGVYEDEQYLYIVLEL
jgi:serine/threonine-protein kinase Chk2